MGVLLSMVPRNGTRKAITDTASRMRSGRPTRAEATLLEERLRTAAIESFLEHGFDGTTMEAVAQAAGVTKRTLYAHYSDKRTLFAHAISWAIERHPSMESAIEAAHAATEDLEAGLTAIARSALELARDPVAVRLVRMGMTESSRFPELADRISNLLTSPRNLAVAEFLAFHAATGSIEVDDITIAAEQFLAMITATPSRLAAFGITRPPDVEERNVRQAVKLFIKATRPGP